MTLEQLEQLEATVNDLRSRIEHATDPAERLASLQRMAGLVQELQELVEHILSEKSLSLNSANEQ